MIIYVPDFAWNTPSLAKLEVSETPRKFKYGQMEILFGTNFLYGTVLDKSRPHFSTQKEAYSWLVNRCNESIMSHRKAIALLEAAVLEMENRENAG
jgi:hypothetical protein